jgi:hypothetical protein
MLKVYNDGKMATAVLTECEYDAILYYSKRLTDTLNSQIPGCDSFNIIFNSFNFGKHSINQDLRLPCKFQATVMINGDTQEDIIAAENAAKKRVLDGYHNEMRKAKLVLIAGAAKYTAKVMGRLIDMSYEIAPWDDDEEDSAPHLFNGIPAPKHHHMDTSDNDNERRPVIPASLCLSMLSPSDYDGDTVPSFNDLVKAGEDAVEDEDDDPIEGDRVSANSNFSSREPLTEKDEDDYTDDVELTDPIPCKKTYETPVIIPVDEDGNDIPESDSDSIL